MEKRVLSRRELLRWSTMAAAGAALAACAPKTVEVEKTVEKTVVVRETVAAPTPVPRVAKIVYFDMDESGAGDEGLKVYEGLAKDFSDRNPDVQVSFEAAVWPWDEPLIARMAAGTAPDIFFHYTDVGQQLMQGGQCLALQEHFQKDELSDFYECQMVAFYIGPSLFALPKYVSAYTLVYNKDMLDEAGVSYPDGSWDWTDLYNALDKVKSLGRTEAGTRWGFMINRPYHQHWVWMNGGEWMNKEFLGTKCLINQPKSVEAERYLYDMIYKYGYAPKTSDVEGVDWTTSWQSGRFAFQDGYSWGVTDFVRSCKFRWDFTVIKGPAGIATQVGSDAYSIWAKTKEPEAAVRFLRYLTSAEIEKHMMLSVHGWHPSRKSLQEAYATETPAAKAGFNVKALTDVMPYARQIPYFYNHAKVFEIMNPIWEQIWDTGELPLEEGLDKIATLVNEYLDSVV